MAVPISGRVILTLFSLPNCGLRDRLTPERARWARELK